MTALYRDRRRPTQEGIGDMGHLETSGDRLLRRTVRMRRRRDVLASRLGAAHTPSQRVGAAAGYLRGALEKAPREVADRAADVVVEQLVRAGEDVYRAIRKGRAS